MCPKCHQNDGGIPDNVSASGFSMSTAQGSSVGFGRGHKKKGDSDGGEPAHSAKGGDYTQRPYRKYVFAPGFKPK